MNPPRNNKRYKFKATETYWKGFYALPPHQKESCREIWKRFRENPFDPSLRPHKMHRASSLAGRTVYGVDIESDLRTFFFVEGDTVVSLDIGTHDAMGK